ncbi:TetR/AcrR family transcriptional regulator [Hyphomicrobium sp.]|uniref:TetR/AcrR family transcriptional regulator n=1 Tax=Hyphomicrobium sp. TaxID=82 RepID=UPI002E364C53|nr:TetR/AcrR family transcriptional regulator [Hyphomicrobium sp.]HEX2839653.1 TetR/AcrR family transcriptional regulator [Hyphomicrobium sp.]
MAQAKRQSAKKTTAVRAKKSFHHGDLREALIAATRELLIEHGPDGFTLADACRRAGVTTAAPYKHFRDKLEILEEIVARGFDQLSEQNAQAVAEKGSGTIEGITAMGISYLEFAVAQPAIFRLMFGELKKSKKVDGTGDECLKNVVEEVAHYCRKNGQTADAQQIAVRLWTFVHGAASLELDGDYERVVPGLDVYNLIADVTPRLLGATSDIRAPRNKKG